MYEIKELQEKVIEVTWHGKPVKIVLQELSYPQRNDCLRKSTTTDVIAQTARVDVYKFNELRLALAIQKTVPDLQAFIKSPECPSGLGDMLLKELDAMGALDAETQKNSPSPSGPDASSGVEKSPG